MTYKDEIRRAMNFLADRHAIFLGQAVEYPGTAMTETLADVSSRQKMELPVAEDLQMGLSIGFSLAGALSISIFPRWNFLLLATNQLVNHLDKIPIYSSFRPKVIIRVGIGSIYPLDPGPQHSGDFTEAFDHLLKMVRVIDLDRVRDVFPEYERAARFDGSTLLIEHMDMY